MDVIEGVLSFFIRPQKVHLRVLVVDLYTVLRLGVRDGDDLVFEGLVRVIQHKIVQEVPVTTCDCKL